VGAEIWVHGDGAILAPCITLPFIDIPVEHDGAHAASLSTGFLSSPERQWGECLLDLQLRIADLPPDSKLVICLLAMTGTSSTKMIASTVMPLFRHSKKQGDGQLLMRTGRTHAFLWPGAEPDLSGATPSHVPGRKAASLPENIEEKVNLNMHAASQTLYSRHLAVGLQHCALVPAARRALSRPCGQFKKASPALCFPPP